MSGTWGELAQWGDLTEWWAPGPVGPIIVRDITVVGYLLPRQVAAQLLPRPARGVLSPRTISGGVEA